MRPSVKVLSLVSLILIASLGLAQGGESLQEQLQTQYALVKMGADSNGPAVIEAGTLLIMQKGGILGVPYGNMNHLPAKYQDGTLHPPATAMSNSSTSVGSKVCGLFGRTTR
jgi:hypothetical protein